MESFGSSNICSSAVIKFTDDYFKMLGLSAFLLEIPLSGTLAEQNRKGIREKILKNRSNVVTPYNSESSIVSSGNEPIHDDEALKAVDQLMLSLTVDTSKASNNGSIYKKGTSNENGRMRRRSSGSQDLWGYVVIIAGALSESSSSSGNDTSTPVAETSAKSTRWRPVAGGIISLVDADERQILGMWCKRDQTPEQAQKFCRILCIRLICEAFNILPEDNPNLSRHSKLLSIFDVHLRHFPRYCQEFLTSKNLVGLGSHYETTESGGTHQNNPTLKCNCSRFKLHQEAKQFWGESESRFLDQFRKKHSEWIPDFVLRKQKPNYDHYVSSLDESSVNGGKRQRRSVGVSPVKKRRIQRRTTGVLC